MSMFLNQEYDAENLLILRPEETGCMHLHAFDTVYTIKQYLNQKWFESATHKISPSFRSYLQHVSKTFCSFRTLGRELNESVAHHACSHEAFSSLFKQAFSELYPVVAVRTESAVWKKGWVPENVGMTAIAMHRAKREILLPFGLPPFTYEGFYDEDGDSRIYRWGDIAHAYLMDTEQDYAAFVNVMKHE